MIKESLRKIGFTEGESKVYSALLDIGSTTTGSLIKKSGISGSKIYEVLERLISKGVVSHIIKNNVKYFEPSRPERILDFIDEKKESIEKERKEIEKVLPNLIEKYKSFPKSEVKIFTGFEGIKTANEDIILSLNKGEEWLSMGLTEQPEHFEMYFNKKQIERSKKGIKHKHILNKKYQSLYKKRKNLPHTQIRFFPNSFDMEMPTSTEIYKNKVIIMILIEENPLAIMIESKEVAESFTKYFNVLWNLSKS